MAQRQEESKVTLKTILNNFISKDKSSWGKMARKQWNDLTNMHLPQRVLELWPKYSNKGD